MNKAFVINNRFFVNPVVNNLTDTTSGKETRLEPRLMNVLCFLAANVNQLVTREDLIREVWNNYGGADEGLSQAISFLRKMLGDTNKRMIETVPTKGYLLNAEITASLLTEEKAKEKTDIGKPNNKKKRYWIAAVMLIVTILGTSLFYWYLHKDDNSPIPPLRVQPMPDIKTDVKPTIILKRKLPPLDSIRPRDSI